MPNANRDKGLIAERDVARYCRSHGMPGAERSVSTGWKTGGRSLADTGDIKGVPGVCIQIKNLSKPLAGKALADAMLEVLTQAEAAGAALPLLLEKRSGHASPGEWWAHLPGYLFAGLAFGLDPYSGPCVWSMFPVRIEFHHIVDRVAAFSRMCEQGVSA